MVTAREAASRARPGAGCWTPVERFDDALAGCARIADSGFAVALQWACCGDGPWDLLGRAQSHECARRNRRRAARGRAGCRWHRGAGGFRECEASHGGAGRVRGVTVYDDFAHHPTAIETTHRRLAPPGRRTRIIAVLEPRSNTMKLGVMKAVRCRSLADADLVSVYARGLGWDAAAALMPLGSRARVASKLDELDADVARAVGQATISSS